MLEVLKLDHCYRVTGFGLINVVHGCSRLKELSLRNCAQLTSIDVRMLSVASRLVRRLRNQGNGDSSESEEEKEEGEDNFEELQTLMMFGKRGLQPSGAESVGSGALNTFREELEKKGMAAEEIEKEMEKARASRRKHQRQLRLQVVDFRGCFDVDDVALRALARRSPELREVRLQVRFAV